MYQPRVGGGVVGSTMPIIIKTISLVGVGDFLTSENWGQANAFNCIQIHARLVHVPENKEK